MKCFIFFTIFAIAILDGALGKQEMKCVCDLKESGKSCTGSSGATVEHRHVWYKLIIILEIN